MAGKADWLAFGRPFEGAADLIGDRLTPDVPTCGLTEPLGDVRPRIDASRLPFAVVVNRAGVVLGRVDHDALHQPDATRVEEVVSEGPATVRPSEETEALSERMRRAGVDGVLVTRSDGTLVGLFERGHADGPPADATS